MTETVNKKVVAEFVLVVMGASFMGSIGILALWSSIFGIEPGDLNQWHVIGILLGLFGGIAGTMLLSMCVPKNAKSSDRKKLPTRF